MSMENPEVSQNTPLQLSRNAKAGHSAAVAERDQRVRQSVCAACWKTVRPGGGIVVSYGAGGRVHQGCFKP